MTSSLRAGWEAGEPGVHGTSVFGLSSTPAINHVSGLTVFGFRSDELIQIQSGRTTLTQQEVLELSSGFILPRDQNYL